jgi:arylsulfatase
MFGCRALYHRGWKAVTHHPIMDPQWSFDRDRWELYHVEDDIAERHDLAATHPEKLRELVERWWIEAAKYQVLPLDNRPFSALVGGRPPAVPPRARYVYYPGAAAVPEAVAVNVRNRSHAIAAEVEIPDHGADGVLLAQGSLLGGWSFHVQGGRLGYVHNHAGRDLHRVEAKEPLRPGPHTLGFRFTRTGEHRGTATLLVDGTVVGEIEIPQFTPTRFSLTGAGLSCGYSGGLPVTDDYRAPFRFTGRLRRVVVEVEGPPYTDPWAEAELAIVTQ